MVKAVTTLCRIGLALGGSLLIVSALGSRALAVDIVPEIDPSFVSSAMTLLIGSTLVIMGRRAKD
jgi:hypothetical protein